MLRVIQPFAGHAVGDAITDSSEIEAILDSEHAAFVVSVADPELAPAPSAFKE